MDSDRVLEALRAVATEPPPPVPTPYDRMAAGLQAGTARLHSGVEVVLTAVEDDSTWHPLLQRLRLGHKFTVVLAVGFLVGMVITGLLLNQILQRRAEGEIMAKSELLTGFQDAIRAYTNNDLSPLLLAGMREDQDFVMETVPSFATKQVFALLHNDPSYRNFTYKPAALNPTNPEDLADGEEARWLAQFRNDPSLKRLSGYRELSGQTVFYSAQPMVVTSERCLECHTDPAVAPPSMVAQFGNTGGFGWSLGEIVGTQVVYVPSSEVVDSAHRSLWVVLGVIIGIFSAMIILINVLLRRLVVWPVHSMSSLAGQITEDELHTESAARSIDAVDRVARRADELGQSARALQKMAREVYLREQRLREQVQQLRIEIDQGKKEHEVREITESEFFQNLQEQARRMRNRPRPGGK
jgi:hypothetical protein